MPSTPITLHVCLSEIAFCVVATDPTRAAEVFASEVDAAGIEIEDVPPCAYTLTARRADVPEIVRAMLNGYDRAHREATIARM